MAISYANIQVTKVLTLRGNTIQNNRYTGLPGELTVDTEAKTIRIHDGTTPGGNVIQGSGGGASSYSNTNVAAYTQTMGYTNYSNVNVIAYTESMGFQNYSNVNVAAYVSTYATTQGYTNYSNVNVAAYLNSNNYNPYSNVNVATYLSTYTGNIGNISTVSNITTSGYFIGNGSLLTGVMTSTSYDLIRTDSFVLDLPNPTPPETRWANITLDNNCGQLVFQRVSGSSNYNYLTYTLDGSNPLISGTAISVYLPNGSTQRINVPGGATVKTTLTGGDNFSGAVLTFYQYRTYYTNSYSNIQVSTYLTQFDGNIIPSANAVYSLGTVTNQWKSLFVSNSTIYVGGVPLSIDNTGNLTVNGNTIPTVAYVNTVVANVTVDLSSYALNANVTAANVGMKGYVDSQSFYSNTKVSAYLSTFNGNIGNLWIDSTTYSPDLWLRTRQNNNIYISPDDINHLFLPTAVSGSQLALAGYGLGGAGVFSSNSYVQLDGNGWDSGIELRTSFNSNNYTWTFSNIGNLTFPTGASITNGYPGGTVGDGQGWFVTPSGNAGGVASADGQQYVQVNNGYGIEIGTGWPGNAHAWHFGLNGNLTLPEGGYLGNVWGEPSETTLVASPGGFVAIANSSGDQYVDANDNNVQIGTNYRSGGGNVWLFYQNGWLVFPDNSVQTTAFSNSAISTYLLAETDKNIHGNVTIAGNLTVNGNISYINVNNFTTNDNIINLADLNPADSLDLGFSAHRTVNFTLQHTGLVRDASANQWRLFSNVIPQPGTTVDFTNAVYDDIQVGNITSPTIDTINNNITAANVGIKGYIDLGNTIQAAAIVAANLGMKGYVDSLSSTYSNVQVATYLPTYTGTLAGGSLSLAGQDGTTVVDFQTGAATNQIITLSSDYTLSVKAGAGASNRGHLVLESGQNSRVKINGNGSNVLITAGNGTQSSTWIFANSGVLTFPDGTTQSTAGGGGGSNYGNGNVASYLITNGYVNTNSAYGNGNVTAYTVSMGFTNYSNVNAAAYVTSLGHTNYSNSNVASYLITNGYVNTNSAYGNGNVTSYLPTHTGNVGVNYLLGTTPNVILTAGTYNSTFDTLGNVSLPNVYVQGNVTASYFIGNGSQLTGLPSSYSNVQTAAYLNSMGYNLYSNVNVAAYMPTYLSSYTGNITAQNITVNGNINLIGNALQINSAVFYGNTGTGFSALYAGAPGYTALPQVVAQFTTNYNGYSQLNSQNLGVGNQASTDFVATANNGNDSTFFLDLGIAGNGYDPAVGANNNALGTVISPNDVYLYSAGNLSTQPGGNIAIGTQTAGKVVKIFAGGVNAANVVLTVANTGITTSNVTANYFIGSGQFLTGLPTAYSNVNVKAYTESMGFQNYGNVNVAAYTSGLTNYSNVNAQSYTESMGFKNYSNVNVAAYLNATGYNLYSNVNVASYLSTATINTTGNITAQNISGNISITGNVTGTSANVTLQAGSNTWIFDNQGNLTLPANADIIGAVTFTGNVTAPYFVGNGALLTGIVAGSNYSNVQVATYLPTYTGVVTASNVAVNGNITAQYLFGNGSQLTGLTSNYSNVNVATYLPTYSGNIANVRLGVAGVLTFADGTTQTTAGGGSYSNVQVATYLPTYTGSINAANILVTGANITLGNIQATTAATNTATGALRVMGGVGVAGSLFAGQLNTTGNLVANTVSVYSLNTVANVVASVVNAGTINSAGNVLAQNIIGTIATASQTGITAVGTLATLNVTGNATVGNLIGTEANTRIIANVYTTTFDIYGNVSFPGNVNVAGLGIVMPARPAFRVNGTGLVIQTPSANVNLKGSAISVAYNQGSYFNATTGIFTAPIAGLYQASINCRIGTNNGLNQVGVLKNGTIAPNPVCWWETDTNTGTAVHFSSVGTVQLAVGDWLSANIIAGNISFDGNDNWCVTYLG